MSETNKGKELKELIDKVSKLKSEPKKLYGACWLVEVFADYYTEVLRNLLRIFYYEDRNFSVLLQNGEISVALEQKIVDNLQTFLANNWELVRGTALSYTAIPTHPLTDFLVEVAQYVSRYDSNRPGALQTLMPTLVAIESTLVASESSPNKHYPHLTDLEISEVLKTYILGREGAYLIPVKQFLEFFDESNTKYFNYYYDYSKERLKGMEVLSPEECARLAEHSPYTKSLLEAYTHYEATLQQQGSLLGHLRQLCRLLYINSKDGSGKEFDADVGAYGAIARFKNYYDLLSVEQKQTIPENVLREIYLLFLIASPKDVRTENEQINHEDNLYTCIATRRSELLKAISGKEEALANIGVSDAVNKKLIEQSKKQLDLCKADLLDAVNNKTYGSGQDKLGLTIKLMKALNVSFQIVSEKDFNNLIELSPDEIKALCQDKDLQQQLIAHFNNFEYLVEFILNNSHAKIAVILALKNLVSTVLEQNQNQYLLSNLLSPMNQEKITIIFQAVLPDLPKIIKNKYELVAVLKLISPEQHTELLKIMKDELTTIIDRQYAFIEALEILAPDQRTELFKTMQDKLTKMITNSDAFTEALKLLASDQRTELFKAMRDKLTTMIITYEALYSMSEFLPKEQVMDIFASIQDRLPQISIEYSSTVLNMLRIIDCEKRIAFLASIKDQLPQIMNEVSDFYNLCDICLGTPEQLGASDQSKKDVFSIMLQALNKAINIVNKKDADETKELITTLENMLCSAFQESVITESFDDESNSVVTAHFKSGF